MKGDGFYTCLVCGQRLLEGDQEYCDKHGGRDEAE